jgi:hypothetical protein
MTEFERDVDKLSNDLTSQSRNNIMYIFSFLLIYILPRIIEHQKKQIVDEH